MLDPKFKSDEVNGVDPYLSAPDAYGHKIHIPKKIAVIILCNVLHFEIDDSMNFQMPTDEQRINLKEMLCIDVVPIKEG